MSWPSRSRDDYRTRLQRPLIREEVIPIWCPRIIRARFAVARAAGLQRRRDGGTGGFRAQHPRRRQQRQHRRARASRSRSVHPEARCVAPARPGFAGAGTEAARDRHCQARPTRSRSRSSRCNASGRSGCWRSSAPTRLRAQRLADEIPWFAPGLRVALLPDWETLPYDPFSPHHDLVSERLATLYRVSRGECDVLVVAATTALYRLAPPSYLAAFTFFLKQGDAARRRRAARAALARRLSARHAGRVAGRVQRPRRTDRSLSDGQHAALSARSLRRRHRKHPHVRRRHAAHALPGARRAAAAGARVPARRGRANALSQPLSRSVRRRSVEIAAVQGREPRRRARRHRVLPAALLRGDCDARRLSAARRRDCAGRRCRRRDRALLAGYRVALQAAARRQGAPAAAADRGLSARGRVQRSDQAVLARRIAGSGRRGPGHARPCHATAIGAGRPPRRGPARGAEALSGDADRHARADLRRKRGTTRDDAAILRRVRAPAAAGR